MENNNLKTQVFNLVILDKSGSMTSIAKAAIEGFNETVGGIRSAQKQFAATQEHYVSLLPFCACSMEYVYDCVPVEMVANLTSRDYQPCCSTPLYDAMGKGITDLFEKTRKMENASVVVTIITDGMENASQKYSGMAIKDLVDKMSKEYGWNFAYIGTNQDVESVAMNLSITNTFFFQDTEEGMGAAWEKERKAKHRMFNRMDGAFTYASAEASFSERSAIVREALRTKSGQVFVFGSNGKGEHIGGSSKLALDCFGAVMGQAEGLQGRSYAIDSMDGLEVLREQAIRFVVFAKEHPEYTFLVTAIGCGVAGYTPRQVAPLFVGAVDVENIWLPKEFWDELV